MQQEQEQHADAVSEVMEWLDSLGPGDMEHVTNSKVLKVLDLQDKTAKSKLFYLVIAMTGIHASWQDRNLRDRFEKYFSNSKSSLQPRGLRKLLETEPSAPWVYLVRVVRGDLHQPALLSPKLPNNLSKVARLLHKALEKFGEGEQQCQHCGQWGDHKVCGCLEVVYCSAECQEMDEQHSKNCLDLLEKNPMLLRRSDLRYRQRANSMGAAVKMKQQQLRRILEERARQTEGTRMMSRKLEKARATLGLARKVSLLEQKLARVPRLREGDSLVALSVPKQEGVARLVPLPHPFLKLWQGQLEQKPDPALPSLAVAEPALAAEAALAADAALPADLALPAVAALPAQSALQAEAALGKAGLKAQDAAPAPAEGQTQEVSLPQDNLLPAPEDLPVDAPGPALPPAVRKSRAMARERGGREKAPPRYTRRDKGVFVELGISHRPFSKVWILCLDN